MKKQSLQFEYKRLSFCRKPYINYQMSLSLRYASLYSFLRQHSRNMYTNPITVIIVQLIHATTVLLAYSNSE